MKVRHWGFLIVAFCVIVTVAALFALSWNSRLIVFTNVLQAADFVRTGDWYSADLTWNNATAANIGVRVSNVTGIISEVPVMIEISHQEHLDLKSLKVSLTSGSQFVQVALSVPFAENGPYYQFYSTSDSRGACFNVPELGVFGSGTVVLNFFVKMYGQNISFVIDFELSMQNTAPLTFSREVASTQLSMNVNRI